MKFKLMYIVFYIYYKHFYVTGFGSSCVKCNKWFSTRATLMKHKVWHHKSDLPRFKFNCTKCPYGTDVGKNFSNHSIVHDESRPFYCTICGNRFKATGSLNHHLLIHTGENMLELPFMII